MRLISDAAEYALRAVIWLAQHPRGPHRVQIIARDTLSKPGYLIKVMQSLGRAGIVSSRRGIAGGYVLERDPESLTVLDVIKAIDSIGRIDRCPLGLSQHAGTLCPLHRRLDHAIALIEQRFAATTIHELLVEAAAPGGCAGLNLGGPAVRPQAPFEDHGQAAEPT